VLSQIGQDLRFAARLLIKSKGFTLVAVLALALGIGGTTVMYSAVDGVLLRPLPYPESQRMVRLWEKWGNGGTGSVSLPNLEDWHAQSHTIELLSGMISTDQTLVRDGVGERVGAMLVTPDFFPLLGARPALGRLFSADAYARNDEVVISHELWTRHFGGANNALGKSLQLSDKTYVVVGVLPAGFRLPAFAGGVYLPLVHEKWNHDRDSHSLSVIGRLAPGATLTQARAEMETIGRALERAYPNANKDRNVLVRSWQESLTAQLRPAIWLLFGAVLLVLIIACANVANMLLARAAARRGELALRVALGASRARVVQQLLTECFLLALLGGIAGLAVALWGIDATHSVLRAGGGVLAPALDARALVFAAAVALGSTFAFGLVPALRATRTDLASAVKEGGRSVAGARSRLRATLVILQVALSFALLVGAALLGRSFLRVANVEPGFDPHGVVTLQMSLPDSKEPLAFFERVLERVRALPEVTHAGITDYLPLSQNNTNGDFDIEGRTLDDPNRYTEYMVVSPDYFDTLGMHLVRGRGILPSDMATAAKVCVINQTMARRWFGSEDVLGKHMRIGWTDDKSWMTIVGVLADSHRWGLDGNPTPETYVPFAQLPWRRMALAVRGHGSTGDLAALVRREVAAVDATEATYDVTTMGEAVDESLRPRKVLLDFTGVFGAIALGLAALGLYGVLAVQVVQRTRELGIRMALGARPADVRRLVVRQAVALSVTGAGLGAIAALLLSSLLSKMLYGVVATDPPTYVAVAVTLILISVGAAWLPARRATAIDPMVALRA